jgi:hypothetical protein
MSEEWGCAALGQCTPCSPPNGPGRCSDEGLCVLDPDRCFPPYRDCNGDPEDGCETNIATNAAHCGDCDTPAPCPELFLNAEPACARDETGRPTCGIRRCDSGYADCDGLVDNGCEAELAFASCDECPQVCGPGQTCIDGVCSP